MGEQRTAFPSAVQWTSMSGDEQTAVPRSYGTSQETDCCTDGSEYQIGAAIVVRRNLEGLDFKFCACTENAQPFKAEMSATLGMIDDYDVEAHKTIVNKELDCKWLLLQKKELYEMANLSIAFFMMIPPGYTQLKNHSHVSKLTQEFISLTKDPSRRWSNHHHAAPQDLRTAIMVWDEQNSGGQGEGLDTELILLGCLEHELKTIFTKAETSRKKDARVDQQVMNVKVMAYDMIQKEAERAPLIEANLKKATELESTADKFKQITEKVKDKYWWENMKCWIAIGAGGFCCVLISIIVLLIVTKTI